MIEYRKAAQEFRDFITKNADLELDLKMNEAMFSQQIHRNQMRSCKLKEKADKSDIEIVCDLSQVSVMKINTADLLVLKQLAAGEIVYTTLYTSYGVGNVEEVLKKQKVNELTPEELVRLILPVQNFGVLLRRTRPYGYQKIRCRFECRCEMGITVSRYSLSRR